MCVGLCVTMDNAQFDTAIIAEQGEKENDLSPIEDVVKERSKDGEIQPSDVSVLFRTLVCWALPQFGKRTFDELLVGGGLQRIMWKQFRVDRTSAVAPKSGETNPVIRARIQMMFRNLRVDPPRKLGNVYEQSEALYPCDARNNGITYAGMVHVEVTVILTGTRKNGQEEEVSGVVHDAQICLFPIIFRSKLCNTFNMTNEQMELFGEDPRDPGGAFNLGRNERVVQSSENIVFNRNAVYKVAGKYHCVIISQVESDPYGHSAQLYISLKTTGGNVSEISLFMNSPRMTNYEMPFYALFRLLGVTSDQEIISHMVDSNDTSDVARKMRNIISAALRHSPREPEGVRICNDPAQIALLYLPHLERGKPDVDQSETKTMTSENQRRISSLMGRLDDAVLPHLGMDVEDRARKLRFVGDMIRELLLVFLGVNPPADRDSFPSKRVHSPGVCLAKAWRQVFNEVVVRIRGQLICTINSILFEKITPAQIQSAVSQNIKMSSMNKVMAQMLSGNANLTLGENRRKNRVYSKALERKNMQALYSTLRMITMRSGSSSKGSSRAQKMRLVHPTMYGIICPGGSAETGEEVGRDRHPTVTSIVGDACEFTLIMDELKKDQDMQPFMSISSGTARSNGLCLVSVNGYPMGWVRNGPSFRIKYLWMRRGCRTIPMTASIKWDTQRNEVSFLTDIGRMQHPMMIVYNNLARYDRARARADAAGGADAADAAGVEFVQETRLTKKHIAQLKMGAIGVDDLIDQGVLEIVSADETVENCLFAPDYKTLISARNDVTIRYTHCSIPDAIYGPLALLSPALNHTQAARITLEVCQGKSAGSYYCGGSSWIRRMDHMRFMQIVIQNPICSTISNEFAPPVSSNAWCAEMCWHGLNQEDSVVGSIRASATGFMAGLYLRVFQCVCEAREELKTPDATTFGVHPNSNYSKLQDGVVSVGSVLRKNDVVISKIACTTSGASTDHSVTYPHSEPGVVIKTHRGVDEESMKFAKVQVCNWRPLGVGDKISSRHGNKGIIAALLYPADLPCDRNGVPAQFFINPHSFPSRMTVAGPIEKAESMICMRECGVKDLTGFAEIDVEGLPDRLEKVGFRRTGEVVLYNTDGLPLQTTVAVGPYGMQRLCKFATDENLVSGSEARKDSLTHQPQSRVSKRGGLRLGEYEAWQLCASIGCAFTLGTKLHVDSNGQMIPFCTACGTPAIYNKMHGFHMCTTCKGTTELVNVQSTHTALVHIHEIQGAGIGMKMMFAEPEIPTVEK